MTELNTNIIVNKISKYTDNGVPFIDAIVAYAEEEGLEIEEAIELNMVEKIARLPF
jgi:hypothetical protein